MPEPGLNVWHFDTVRPLAASKSRFFAPLRSALQKLDALLVSIEQLGASLSDPFSPRN
jgi:hypothetical protein